MKYLQAIRLPCWLLLAWLVVLGLLLPTLVRTTARPIVIVILLFVQGGIYLYGFSFRKPRYFLTSLLVIQILLVLFLALITQSILLTLGLSLALFVAMIDWLRKIRFILPVAAVYLALCWFFYGFLIRLPANPYGKDAVSLLPVLLAVGCLALYGQQEFAYQHTKRLVSELHAAHAHLSAYALRVEELTMLTERQRIARDLHDTLVQGLAGLIMQLDTIQTHAREQHIERVQILMQQVIEDARETLTDARYALGDLRSEHIRPDDLADDIQEEMNRFMARTAIACEIDIEGLTLTPEPYCEHILRFITEALTNIERHAHASHAWITARHRSDALNIEVRDDGVGFDPATIDPQRLEIGHYGLLGMRERARLAQGRLEVVSAPNKGTTLRLQLPLSKDTLMPGERKYGQTHSSPDRR